MQPSTKAQQPMSGSTSIARAEERALAGDNDSQDSQLVLDMYMQMYGIGLMSSSPPEKDEAPFHNYHPARKPSYPTQAGNGHKGSRKALKPWPRTTSHPPRSGSLPLEFAETRNANNVTGHHRATSLLGLETAKSARRLDGEGPEETQSAGRQPEKAAVAASAVELAEPCPIDRPAPSVQPSNALAPTEPTAANPKMDSSQSPTQSNNGRSYDRYFVHSTQSQKDAPDHEDTAPAAEALSQASSYEQRSLLEDDTGAVVFDLEHHVALHTDTSLPSDHSPQLARASLRTRTFALQRHTSESQEQLPETPAVRHNPFAGNNQFQLLPTSQLFRATQFSSALRRGASPTSSRPSPNDFPHNTISPNHVSSPLKDRGLRSTPTAAHVSSPVIIRTSGSPLPNDDQTTPFHTASTKDPVLPDSPQHRGPKARTAPAPMDVYVPMRQSQERRSSSLAARVTASPELSDDGDDPVDRRRRARSKKEASLKRLTSIHFTRTPKREDVEVPSTNTKKRKSRTQAEEYVDQCHGLEGSDDDLQCEDRVENSQDQTTSKDRPHGYRSSQGPSDVSAEDGVTRYGATRGQASPRRRRGKSLLRLDSTDTSLANGETIPETSPVDKQPMSFPDTQRATLSSTPKLSSNPAVLDFSRSLRDATGVPKSSVTEYAPPATASGNTAGNEQTAETPDVVSSTRGKARSTGGGSSPTLPKLDPEKRLTLPSSPPAPAFSTRSKMRQHDFLADNEPPAVPSSRELPQPSTSMSSLSMLSCTPSMTMSTTTPGSQGSGASRKSLPDAEEMTNWSPAVSKNKRRRIDDLPRLKTTTATENLRASTRLSRQRRMGSTDELAKSPSTTPTFEHSLRVPPRHSTSRPARTSTADPQPVQDQSHRQPGKLFEGMAFAVSFQAKKPGESQDQYMARMDKAKSLQEMIVQAGGKVLKNGFDELFETAPVRSATSSPVAGVPSSPPDAAASVADREVNLTPQARHLGFTALVADAHTRKEKYMQALALGLPCLAARWVTACVGRGEVVDWAPYLLCAGESAYLGGACRSRGLAAYDAAHARLADVVERRPRLLAGSRILLVMKKAEQSRKMAYVFLARVLGAALCRVHTLEEARARLKAAEELGRPFDWVYAGGRVDTAELFADGQGGAGTVAGAGAKNRKRKRGGGSGGALAASGPPPKKIRTLSDELVIQSLILGRLIGEGDMEE